MKSFLKDQWDKAALLGVSTYAVAAYCNDAYALAACAAVTALPLAGSVAAGQKRKEIKKETKRLLARQDNLKILHSVSIHAEASNDGFVAEETPSSKTLG